MLPDIWEHESPLKALPPRLHRKVHVIQETDETLWWLRLRDLANQSAIKWCARRIKQINKCDTSSTKRGRNKNLPLFSEYVKMLVPPSSASHAFASASSRLLSRWSIHFTVSRKSFLYIRISPNLTVPTAPLIRAAASLCLIAYVSHMPYFLYSVLNQADL